MVNRSAIAKVTAVGVMAVLIAAGAVGIYFYTAAPTTTFTSSSTSRTTTSSSVGGSSTSSAVAPFSGYQDNTGQPQGAWADYLGYIPAGYTLAPHFPNAAIYPCPPGMNPSQCKQFQTSCGNGVCDPNESCASCPIDCGVSGQGVCDPYTGRPGAPISICQMPAIGA
jgi:hypothetical protein